MNNVYDYLCDWKVLPDGSMDMNGQCTARDSKTGFRAVFIPNEIFSDEETWKRIPDHGDMYDVSNKGRVRKKSSGSPLTGIVYKFLKPINNGRGGWEVHLYYVGDNQSKRRKDYLIGHLVARAFLQAPSTPIQVFYKDGDHQNNDASNLLWRDNLPASFGNSTSQ